VEDWCALRAVAACVRKGWSPCPFRRWARCPAAPRAAASTAASGRECSVCVRAATSGAALGLLQPGRKRTPTLRLRNRAGRQPYAGTGRLAHVTLLKIGIDAIERGIEHRSRYVVVPRCI
jgi:hypothetical protein